MLCAQGQKKPGGFMNNAGNENMDLLSVKEAADYLKFSIPFLYRLAREKKIPHVNFGRHIIFRKTDLYNWLGNKVCQVQGVSV